MQRTPREVIVIKLPEFNLFSDKSSRIFLIFPNICQNFHGFTKFVGAVAPPPPAPLSCTPTVKSSGLDKKNSSRAHYMKLTSTEVGRIELPVFGS